MPGDIASGLHGYYAGTFAQVKNSSWCFTLRSAGLRVSSTFCSLSRPARAAWPWASAATGLSTDPNSYELTCDGSHFSLPHRACTDLMRPRLASHWPLQFDLLAAAQFVTQYSQFRRAIEAQANSIATNLHHRHNDVVSDRYSLADFAVLNHTAPGHTPTRCRVGGRQQTRAPTEPSPNSRQSSDQSVRCPAVFAAICPLVGSYNQPPAAVVAVGGKTAV